MSEAVVYKLDQIKIKNTESALGKVYLVFNVSPESSFYCPGVEVQEKNDGLYVKFVRSRVGGGKPKFDAKAEYLLPKVKSKSLPHALRGKLLPEPSPFDQIVEFNRVDVDIYIYDGDNKKILIKK